MDYGWVGSGEFLLTRPTLGLFDAIRAIRSHAECYSTRYQPARLSTRSLSAPTQMTITR